MLTNCSQKQFPLALLLAVGLLTFHGCEEEKTGLSKAPGTPTLAPTAIITPPTSPDATDGKAEITWTAPTDPGLLDNGDRATITTYKIEYAKQANFSAKQEKVVKGTATSVTLDRLEGRGTTYYVRVYALNGSKKPQSVASASVSFKVGTLATSPGKPVEVAVSPASTTSLTVSVTPPSPGTNTDGSSADIVSYTLEASTSDQFPEGADTRSITVTSADDNEIGQLTSGTAYYVRVRAVNNSDDSTKRVGLWSDPTSGIETSSAAVPPAPVTNLQVSPITASSLSVMWDAVTDWGKDNRGASSLTGRYSITYSPVGDQTDVKTITSATDSVRLANLLSGLAYTITVEAVNSDGVSASGVTVSRQTVQAIPDSVFQVKLRDIIPEAFTEIAGQYYINIEHAGIATIEKLALYSQLEQDKIADLTGIEYFTHLKELLCSYNELTELDLSKNLKLETLECTNNILTQITVSKNTALEVLYCYRNNLSTLDLSKNNLLKDLRCDKNNLTSLDVSQNPKLEDMFCSHNRLSQIDLSQNLLLERFEYIGGWTLDDSDSIDSRYQLTELDVSNNRGLVSLNCSFNRLEQLDLSRSKSLLSIHCRNNNLNHLEVSTNTTLSTIDCGANSLDTLDVSNNVLLRILYCDTNSLTALDLSQNPELNRLRCSHNQLNQLDLSNNRWVRSILCRYNNLSKLDVSRTEALLILNCSNNQLDTLDLSQNPYLEGLACYNNNLVFLDMRGMKNTAKKLYLGIGGPGGSDQVQVDTTSNPVSMLKLYEALKSKEEIKQSKTNRGDQITIAVYSAANIYLADYTQTCANWDPNMGGGTCITQP